MTEHDDQPNIMNKGKIRGRIYCGNKGWTKQNGIIGSSFWRVDLRTGRRILNQYGVLDVSNLKLLRIDSASAQPLLVFWGGASFPGKQCWGRSSLIVRWVMAEDPIGRTIADEPLETLNWNHQTEHGMPPDSLYAAQKNSASVKRWLRIHVKLHFTRCMSFYIYLNIIIYLYICFTCSRATLSE